MIYIETGSQNPYVNLATEEYFLEREDIEEEIFMLWQNVPTIVVGRYQSLVREVNLAYAQSQNIHIVRRSTGGGTVYHDLGNICYSFIINCEDTEKIDFSTVARPFVNILKKIGLPVELSGRNDIVIDGAKCSGTAMRLHKNRLLFHGTLLYDSDLNVLTRSLNVDPTKIKSKGLASVRSRVTNISEHIQEPCGTAEFKERIKQDWIKTYNCNIHRIEPEESERICCKAVSKYMNDAWNFQNDPPAEVHFEHRFIGKGQVSSYLCLEEGRVKSCKLRGDFIGLRPIEELETALCGVKFKPRTILNKLAECKISDYLGDITAEELTDCMVGALEQEIYK